MKLKSYFFEILNEEDKLKIGDKVKLIPKQTYSRSEYPDSKSQIEFIKRLKNLKNKTGKITAVIGKAIDVDFGTSTEHLFKTMVKKA